MVLIESEMLYKLVNVNRPIENFPVELKGGEAYA